MIKLIQKWSSRIVSLLDGGMEAFCYKLRDNILRNMLHIVWTENK